MTVLEYVSEYLPIKCRVHSAFGNVAAMIYQAELDGNKNFAIGNFSSLRERAALGIPYQIDDLKERERILNILELILCIHRQKVHRENYQKRIDELMKTDMAEEERDMILRPKDWWNA